jgi:hypothetical protein
MGTGSLPGVKRPGRVVNHPPPTSADVKERVELYLYLALGLHGLFLGEFYLYRLHKSAHNLTRSMGDNSLTIKKFLSSFKNTLDMTDTTSDALLNSRATGINIRWHLWNLRDINAFTTVHNFQVPCNIS